MTVLSVFVAALCAGLSSASRARLAKLGHETLSTIPMHVFRADCGLEGPVSMVANSSLLGHGHVSHNPGAGMDPDGIVPFAKVLKDGYYQIDCVKDYMFEHGDKFGDNKFSYEIGNTANVSIVHYTIIPREDREAMTHGTCFAFCRTVPDMLFFGIHNGRDCYCAPYYKPMAGDSSMCDAACPGDATTMCGGPSKSSIFAMHQCNDAAQELEEASNKMMDVKDEVAGLATKLTEAAEKLQKGAEELQPLLGNVADRGATGHMQHARVYAGELEATADGAQGLVDTMTTLKGDSATFESADFSDYTTSNDLEELVRQMEKATAQGEVKAEELGITADGVVPTEKAKDADEQYYNVMYFVDEKVNKSASTCSGDYAGPPLPATKEECAATCDKNVGSCVGFSYFNLAEGGLCFLLSSFDSATYYPNCPDDKPAAGTECMAKLQYFSGTSLAPDASGNCKECFKKVTKSDCYDP